MNVKINQIQRLWSNLIVTKLCCETSSRHSWGLVPVLTSSEEEERKLLKYQWQSQTKEILDWQKVNCKPDAQFQFRCKGLRCPVWEELILKVLEKWRQSRQDHRCLQTMEETYFDTFSFKFILGHNAEKIQPWWKTRNWKSIPKQTKFNCNICLCQLTIFVFRKAYFSNVN